MADDKNAGAQDNARDRADQTADDQVSDDGGMGHGGATHNDFGKDSGIRPDGNRDDPKPSNDA